MQGKAIGSVFLSSPVKAKALITAAVDAGWTRVSGGLLNEALEESKRWPWLFFDEDGRYGLSGTPEDKEMTTDEAFQLLAKPKVHTPPAESFQLEPTKGEYNEATIIYINKEIRVGCCTYSFDRVLALADHIRNKINQLNVRK